MAILKRYNSTTQELEEVGGGVGGANALSDLTDTTITSPVNGQVFTYDNFTSQWQK